MERCARLSINCIVPPHILKKLLESKDRKVSEVALNTLLTTSHLRGERSVRALAAISSPETARRTIYDCRHGRIVSGKLARSEDEPASSDKPVNQAFDGFGHTRDFYKQVFNRNSIDDRGMRLNGYVHYGESYQNAFWDGQEMIFGDGDGEIFTDFTGALDVIGHELTHGVTEFTANLEYHNQSGALNESISDVFGSLVMQWVNNQSAEQADWLIGVGIFTPKITGDALRSMKAPGTAYDNDLIGKDPQPDNMSDYQTLPDTAQGDFGGVHINSGIPNKAFYLTAIAIGGNAWEAPGHIWYEALKASTATTNFQEFADTTHSKAGQLYGTSGAEQQAVLLAWREVGIRISNAAIPSPASRRKQPTAVESDSYQQLSRQIGTIAEQIRVISSEISALKNITEKQAA